MSYRIERINSEMRKTLSQIIGRLKDPRMTEMVSVTAVNVAKDLKTAKVDVEIFGDGNEDKVRETFETLCRSGGFIRKELAREFHDLRTIPELTFRMDTSSAYSAHIDKILEEIKQNDGGGNH
ncbi:MAG: 30S ribosome-binding factor RbfA [Clostridia bacterium]|nr:30S ribosome-binding factor RbfA [Clostridia bacterium]